MNIETPGRTPTAEEVRAFEEKMNVFVKAYSEHADSSLEEIHTAAILMATRLINSGKSAEDMDDDMMRRAFEARRSVRGSEKILVSDSQGVVIGAGGSSNEARKIARQESEARDLS